MACDGPGPIDGVGCQSHHIGSLADIDAVLSGLDRLAKLGLEIEITEYDIKLIPDSSGRDFQKRWRVPAPTSPELEELEGRYLHDFMTACFSHPSVTAFIMWGFWDGNHWLHNAPIYRRDWTLKPAGKVYRDLVLKKWWTNTDGTTDATGQFMTRGFLGQYEISVAKGAQVGHVACQLTKATGIVSVRLDADES